METRSKLLIFPQTEEFVDDVKMSSIDVKVRFYRIDAPRISHQIHAADKYYHQSIFYIALNQLMGVDSLLQIECWNEACN